MSTMQVRYFGRSHTGCATFCLCCVLPNPPQQQQRCCPSAARNAVFKYLLAQRELGLVDVTKINVTFESVRLSYVHGIWYEAPPKADVLAHIDRGGPRPPRKARALLVLGAANPPSVREVLVTLANGTDGTPVASGLEQANIHSSTWKTVPDNQRPHGAMDQVG